MKLLKLAGSTSEIWQIFVADSSSTTGGGLTGLLFNTASLTCGYHRDTDTTATTVTLATMTVGTFTSSGFKEVDSTLLPGVYQFCPPNAAIASGAKSVIFVLKGATNMAPLPIEVQLSAINPDDAVRAGMTALPNANAEAAGGLYTRGTGAGQIKQTNNGEIDSNATHINNVATTSVTTVSANQGTTQPLNFTGTAGSALVKSDIVDIAGAAVSTSSAQIGVAVISYASGQAPLQPTVAGRTLDVSVGGEAGLDWANIGAPTTAQGLTGTTIATSQVVASVTGAVGSVTGAVGSVTGAVGSVTGNVGGNVVGSVASVTARVTANTDQLAGQTVTAAAGVTFPTSVASPTNITAGTITTTTNVTNGVSLAVNAVDSAAVATSGAQEIAAAVGALSLGASNNNYTVIQGLTVALSAVAGKVSGENTGAPAFRDLADTKDVITGTDDGSGNRLTITYNP